MNPFARVPSALLTKNIKKMFWHLDAADGTFPQTPTLFFFLKWMENGGWDCRPLTAFPSAQPIKADGSALLWSLLQVFLVASRCSGGLSFIFL